MTDKQVIKKIAKKMHEIRQLLIDNDMFKGSYFSTFIHDNRVSFNNAYWAEDAEHPIKYSESNEEVTIQ